VRLRVSSYTSGSSAARLRISYSGAVTRLSASLPPGSNNLGFVTVNGIEAGTSATSLGKAEDAAHSSGDTGVMMLGVRDDTLSVFSGAENDYEPFHMTSTGRLYVQSLNEANSGVDIGDVTINNASGASAVNIQDGGNSLTVDNGGTFAVQDSEKLADDAAFTVATTKVMPVGLLADETSPDSVNEGDVGAPRMTLDRMQIVTCRPNSTGEGLDIFRSLDLDETEEDVKTSEGKLYGYYIFNAATSVRYVKFYNATAANVTVGTTTPVMTVPVPAGSAANLIGSVGIQFSTAICVAATTGVADSDTGAPAANEVVVNIWYK
jgi:hypothetical protein